MAGYNEIVTRKELRDHALALPPEERARLAHDIITSLDGPSDEDASVAWVSEIERRVRDALRKAGQEDRAREFVERAFRAGSYDGVLQL